tara:strand:- start:4 stop:435 length:432 start_codon:yes stop_codon:yes gene_type:complete
MTIKEESTSFEQRIGNQLHSFCDLSELLTLRIVELEERLDRFEKLRASKKNKPLQFAHQLLEASTEKSSRIKDFLDSNKFSQDADQIIVETDSNEDLDFNIEKGSQKFAKVLDNHLNSFNLSSSEQLKVKDDLNETEYIDDPQ